MIYARVVAKPVNFPAKLDIRYETVDRKTGEDVAVFGAQRSFSWEEVKLRFSVSDGQALECEGQLRQGENALIAQAQEWESDLNPTQTGFGATHRCQVKTLRFESWMRDLVDASEAIAGEDGQAKRWLATDTASWELPAELLMVLREVELFIGVFSDKLSTAQIEAATDLGQAAVAFDCRPAGWRDPNEILRDPAWQSLRTKARKFAAEFKSLSV
jgi:hypothetical protein